jgi:hypothetical protein
MNSRRVVKLMFCVVEEAARRKFLKLPQQP